MILRLLPVALIGLAVAGVPAQEPRPNILLVTIDTLRADRVTPALAPALSALASRGTLFTRAYAHAPTTLASHASILTGLFPPAHGVRNNGTFRLSSSAVTLADVLKEAGYATGAFVSAFVLDARYGLDQGFDEYDDRYPQLSSAFQFAQRRAPDVLAPAAAWIGRQRPPWLAWVHLFDPHAPYDAPLDSAQGKPFDSAQRKPFDSAQGRPERRVSTSYDNEVAYVDRALGRFLSGLGPELLNSSIVVVTSDHGESLGEHGESTHGLFAYDATLRVPLIIAGPSVPTRVVTQTVSHVDIMPTLVALAGLTGPVSDGRSLAPLVASGESLPEMPVYFEALDASLTRGWAPLTGVIAGGWKYIDLPIAELYDLGADSREQTNLASADRARATRLRDLTIRIRTAPQRAGATPAVVDAEARARLHSLGYVGAASWRLGAWREEDDPKRLLDLHARFQRAIDTSTQRPEDAIRQLRALIEQRPDFASAYEATATLLIDTDRPREAVDVLTTALTRGLRHSVLTERLGAALIAAGQPRTAIEVLEPAVQANVDALELRYTLGLAYAAAGDHTRARDVFAAVVSIDPTAPGAWTNLGAVELQRGALVEARRSFESALAVDETIVAAWKGLGAALEQSEPARAVEAWERALTLAPKDYDTLSRLAFLLARIEPSRAAVHLRRLVNEAPQARYAKEIERATRLLKSQSKPEL
jgi:arylsulfatase A-like enzyme/Flp pilus assembly protein TadD